MAGETHIVYKPIHSDKKYIVEPSYETPNMCFVYNLENGKSIVAVFYNVALAHKFVRELNENRN